MPSPNYVFRHSRLRDIEPNLEQFTMDPRRTPYWVGNTDFSDQPSYFPQHARPPYSTAGLVLPEKSEPGPPNLALGHRTTVSGRTIEIERRTPG